MGTLEVILILIVIQRPMKNAIKKTEPEKKKE